MKKPVKVAVTGAGGQIGYALIFRIAAGDLLEEIAIAFGEFGHGGQR